jgi:formylglycine-generating enzyme required for sulfatase activity
MQDIQTFLDEGWDFVGETVNGTADVWRMCVNGVPYPRLAWEFSWGGDLGCPDGVGVEDLVYLCERWLAAGPGAVGAADANGDGKVDLADYAILAEHWLTGERLPEDLVPVPAGTFQMGDSIGDGESNQRPVHTVTLDSFAMGKYEITNGQYCTFLNSAYPSQLKVVNGIVYASGDTANSFLYCDTSTSSSYSQIAFSNNTFSVRTKSARDMSNDPMVYVSWYGAVAYCNWRSQQEGRQACYNLSLWTCDFTKKGYRLATEAEWEYAARGGLSGKRFPWGDTITHSQANYDSSPYYGYDISPTRGYHPAWNDGIWPYTSPVGSFPANGYGLCDMAGNVWEWCNDWYGGYSAGSQSNPIGPTTGSYRVLRGGGWYGIADYCRVANRNYNYPYYRGGSVGFRVVVLDL